MEVTRFHDPAAFAKLVEPFLLLHEAENCYFLGQLQQLENPTDALLLLVHDPAGPIAVATMTPARHLMITDATPEAADAIVDYVVDGNVTVPGVQGPPVVARRFAERCAGRTGTGAAVQRAAMAVHELTRVTPPPGVPGALRQARPGDVELLADWVTEFVRECGLPPVSDERGRARERIERGEAFLWEVDGAAVSTASLVGPTPNGVRISLVYTPLQQRRRGYASGCVAALSQHVLDGGRAFCFLYTDLANPTSNKIYREVGYRLVSESVQLMFDPSAAGR